MMTEEVANAPAVPGEGKVNHKTADRLASKTLGLWKY